MLTSFLITFRESLEAAIIIGIILAFLHQTKARQYFNFVYLGIVSAVVASILSAAAFQFFFGSYEGRAEQMIEGTTMFLAAILITTVIIWMFYRREMSTHLKKSLKQGIENQKKFGIFFLTFINVFREGMEIVIFLSALAFSTDAKGLFIGGIGGIIAAILLGYLIFSGSRRIKIKTFFNVTSILLIFVAAGLIAHATHEYQEAGILPITIEHVWDINPMLLPDGSAPALHEDGSIGQVLKSLFGYNGNPSLLEVVLYFLYLSIALGLFFWCSRKSRKRNMV